MKRDDLNTLFDRPRPGELRYTGEKEIEVKVEFVDGRIEVSKVENGSIVDVSEDVRVDVE